MIIEIKKTTVNYGHVEVKDLKELDSLYSEGAIDEIVSDYVSKIEYKYYLKGKLIKTNEI
jgi:hypothetical protein